MECAGTPWLSDREYLEQFSRKTTQLRVPLSGSVELTRRCNLRCVHCYVGDQTYVERRCPEEMDTRRLLSVIDEITDAGCLFLLLTGGEPLLRKDFCEIYRHAKSNGLLVTLFTNGTLITEGIREMLADLPPHLVEISLYGASAETYEKITGVKGSYKRCLNGIRDLLDMKIGVRLKTVLMTLNEHELCEMERMAKGWGLKFRFDAAIFPRLNGDNKPLRLRVPPEEAVEKEMSDSKRLSQWREFCHRLQDISMPETLYKCGAGLTNFHIDAYGSVMPCLMTTAHTFNPSASTFLKVWNEDIARVREMKAESDFVCNTCKDQNVCGFCPAFFLLENGSENVPSEYLCAMGKHRLRKIYGN